MAFADVNGTRLWYEIQGEGHPIILLPGLGLDHRYYRFGEPLIRPSAKTILIDPRGIGQSQKDSPSAITYSAELWADDVAALLQHLGIARCDILGSSLGGAMAQAVALRHPELVRSLIAIGSFSEVDRAMEINFNLRKRIIAKLGMGEEIADFMGLSTMTREFMATDEGLKIMQANQASVKANSPEHYVAFINSVLLWGKRMPGQEGEALNTQAIKALRCPTLCIAGDNDYFIPASFTQLIAQSIPGARYAEVKSGGHIPFIEKPQETAAIVNAFLKSLN
jgi:pimeloyl-ACP methyl ester carboxylesterase